MPFSLPGRAEVAPNTLVNFRETRDDARKMRTRLQVVRTHALDVPFALRGVATAAGAKWDAEHGVFLFRGNRLPGALAPFQAQRYSLEHHVEAELNDDGAFLPSEPTASIVLRPHQIGAVEAIGKAFASGRPGFLLADDVGLGKTITAWEAVRRMPEHTTVLIVSPLAVVAHWRRTISAMGDEGKDVVVMNYERLAKLFELTPKARSKVRSKKGVAKAGKATSFDVVIWDESHRCKNPTAARSKLAAKLNAVAKRVLWLSATAGQNPLELSYLAPLLASVTGDPPKELVAFDEWCVAQGLGVTRGTFGRWDWRGDPADCEKVHALLFAPRGKHPAAGLRRRPEDLVGWPELNRMLTPIDLDTESRELYAQAWVAFRKEMELAPHGKNPKGALAATLRLRQKSSLLRIGGTLELVRELLDNGHQVAVSVAFHETLTMAKATLEAEKIPCAEIHGKLDGKTKEAERLRFQRGEAKVVFFTVEEGISLHQGELPGASANAPRSEIIHDLRWSAIQMAQIEGRCHRDGKFAQVYWAYADGTLEEKIAEIVCRRITAMKSMVGDDVETLREIERLLTA